VVYSFGFQILLFSTPTETNIEKISVALFPKWLEHKRLAYMPFDGSDIKQVYTDFWGNVANKNGAEFVLVNNSLPSNSGEREKLLGCNILLITGGNTFTLLSNIRRSGLDNAIRDFVKKPEFVLAGFSAGAIVLSPTIQICHLPNFDQNLVGITDLTGLGIVKFEIFPHFDPTKHQTIIREYRQRTPNEVKEITNEDLLVLDKSE